LKALFGLDYKIDNK